MFIASLPITLTLVGIILVFRVRLEALPPYPRWTILVLFNASFSVVFAAMSVKGVFQLAAICAGILTFIPLYVFVEHHFSKRVNNAAQVKKSLFVAALIKGSLQVFPLLHFTTGMLSIAIIGQLTEWLGFSQFSDIDNFHFISYYFTVILDGLILSAGVALLTILIYMATSYVCGKKIKQDADCL